MSVRGCVGSGETKFLARLAAAKKGPAFASNVATNLTGKSVAGHSISFAGKFLYDMLLAAYRNGGVVTKEPNVVASFAVDGVRQALASSATSTSSSCSNTSPIAPVLPDSMPASSASLDG